MSGILYGRVGARAPVRPGDVFAAPHAGAGWQGVETMSPSARTGGESPPSALRLEVIEGVYRESF